MKTTIDSVLLDLDGTLVDSAEGILGSLRQAFAEVGVAEPPGGLGTELLGPPMYVTLPPLVGDAATEEIVLAYRRTYFRDGWQTCVPYEGIDTMLRALVSAGRTIAVATSKQEAVAQRIVEKQGWTDLFTTVCGDTPDRERPTKAAVIGEALSRLSATAAVMVGDRRYDVIGAREHGLDCIGVGWGYAEPGELAEAGARVICASPAEIIPSMRTL